jgi:amino acid permease
MVEMHEMVPGKRFDRYHELGQHAFGEKLGLWIVVPQQLIVEVGVDIVYMVTGGKSLQKFHELVCKQPCKNIKLTYFIMIFASVHFVLSHLPNFNSISGVSLAAAVMSLSYSTIAWGASVHKGALPDVQYGYKATTTSGTVFNFFSALGDVAFAYAGHNVVLEIQATIPSTPENPSKTSMWRGVIVAYIVVALCYFPVAFIGYGMFGNMVSDNILITLEKPTWLIAMANLFVVVHVIGSYQIYAMPVFDMMETVLVKKLRFKPTWYLRFITECLRGVYNVSWDDIPILRKPSGILRRLCFRSNHLLPPLHYVACHIQTEEIQPVLDHKLDLHNHWGCTDDYSTNWSVEANHT